MSDEEMFALVREVEHRLGGSWGDVIQTLRDANQLDDGRWGAAGIPG